MGLIETPMFLDAVIRNALVVEMARAVAISRQVPKNDLDAADKLNTLGGMFGLTVPYHMTMTQLKNIEAVGPALVTLAVQVQYIIRFHIDGPMVWKDLTNIKLPPGWTYDTVNKAYDIIEKIPKAFHLGRDNLPTDGYFNVNDIDMKAFRATGAKYRIGHCLFIPDIDEIYKTSVPSKKQILFGGIDLKNFFGNGIDVVSIKDSTLWNHLCETKILMAV